MINTGEQNLMGKPYQVIRFNKLTGQLEKPTILLKTRGGNTIGELQYTNLNFSFVGKGLDNLSFDVHKVVNGKECKYWDRLIDLCIIDYVGYGQFECNVTINDEDETIKSCVCESLETELGQHTIRDMHINDEDAITYGRKVGNTNIDFDTGETSGKFIPTVLYDENDTQHSLLDRVLAEKTPHWSVGYVSPKFAVNGYVYDADQIERTFTLSGTTPYDFFDSEVSQEFGCVFTYDTYNRKVNCYNLDDCVYDTRTNEIKDGYYYIDGIYYDENDSQIIDDSNLGYCSGIGQDTAIFMSKSKLANSFSIDSDKDSVKNCFYVSGGDDVITNIIGAANVTGDNYIYMFGNFQYEDMSDELVNKIKEYATLLSEKEAEFNKVGGVYIYDSEGKYVYNEDKQRVEDKNGRIIVNSKYVDGRIYVLDTLAYYENGMAYNKDRDVLSSSDGYIYDEPGLYTEYTSLVDRINYWEHTRFPDVIPSDTTAKYEKDKIIEYFNIRKVYIKNGCTSTSFAHVTSAIESLIGIACDSRYTVTIYKDKDHTLTCSDINDDNDEHKKGIWNGVVNIKRTTDETDYAEFDLSVNVELTYDVDNSIELCKQNMEIAIARMDIVELDFTKLSNEELEDLLKKYNLNSLKSFRDGFDSCRATLNDLLANMELEEAQVIRFEDDALWLSSDRYNARYDIANRLYEELKKYLDKLYSQKETLDNEISDFRADLDMKSYFGEKLWKEFRSYVREDEYNNPNYISDGLSNCEILEKAKELLDVAKKELSKACVIQKTISGDINNIFSIEEKEILHDKFALFNYVRVRADDNIYKLRLMEISFSEDSPEKLDVTFSEQIEDVSGKKSDIQKILEQSQSIATTYSSTTKQAKQGASAMSNFNTLKQEGLDSSLYLIKNSNTEEVIFGNTGLSCKSMLDQGIYSPYEVRVTHNGIYMSEDNFNSVKTALGRFKYNNEWVYGLCTDVLFGDLIIGEKMLISNKNGSVSITGDGINITNGSITWSADGSNGVQSPSIQQIDGLDNYLEQLDGRIQTFSQTTDPSIDWTTTTLKEQHTGDIWVNRNNGLTKQWTGTKWVEITDSELKKLAESKAQIFTSEPKPPYYVGDLWSQGSDGDIMICTVAKLDGQVYSSSDWTKASKYTNDDALNNFIEGDYSKALKDINTQIDGKADTFYQSTKPHEEYTNVANNNTYNLYVGDLWYDTTTGKSYMYQKVANGSKYNYIWKFMDVPSDVYDTIDGIASIYVTLPNNPNIGDLLIPNSDIKSGTKTYYAKKVYKYDGTNWTEINYTDDTAWKAWTSDTGEFGQYKTSIQTQIDGKSNCTYGGGTPPFNPETGDLWFCTNNSGGYGANKAYMYNGSSWKESNGVPDSVWDIADGKSSIFVVKPTKSLSSVDSNFYHKNDIWILESDMTLNGKSYKKGSIMTSTSDSTSFVESHWFEKVRYTDDTTAQEALTQAKQGIKDAANALSKANNAYSRAENAETNAKGYADSQDITLSENITKAYQDAISAFDKSVAEYLQVPGATTIVGGNHVISPYIAGGYLYITGDNGSVEINPKLITGYEGRSGDIFNIRNSNNTSVFHVNTSGQVTISGGNSSSSIKLDGSNGSIYTTNGSSKSILASGYLYSTDGTYAAYLNNACLNFKKNDIYYARFSSTHWVDTEIRGVSINSYADSKFISFGNKTDNSQKTWITPLILNYGLNPYKDRNNPSKGTIDKDVIIFGTTYHDDKVYFHNDSYIGTITGGGIYCSSIFGVNGAGYTGYALGVTGSTYISGDLVVAGNLNATYATTAHGLRTYSASGDSHGDTAWILRCMHNVDNDGLFKIYCGDRSIGTKVDCATNATYSTYATKLYRDTYEVTVSTNYNFIPLDGMSSMNCGTSANPWKKFYAESTTIGTSDARYKNIVCNIEDDERYEILFNNLKPKLFKFKNFTENDNHDRIHSGYIAQEVKEAMDIAGIDNTEFAAFCYSNFENDEIDLYDSLTEEECRKKAIENNHGFKDKYMLGYTEFISLNTHMIQKLYKKVDEQQQQINSLQTTLDNVLKEIQQLKQNN